MTEEIVDQVAGDAREPAAEFLRLPQRRQLFPRGEKNFLSQILAAPGIPARAEAQRADHRLVAFHDLAKRRPVPGKMKLDELAV